MRLRLPFLLSALLVTGGLVACGGGGGGGGAEHAEGKRVFAGTCASCHGQDARGVPNLGKSLWNNQFVHAKSDAELVAFIHTGRPASDPQNTTGVDMPPKGGNPSLSEADIQAVVGYIRTLTE